MATRCAMDKTMMRTKQNNIIQEIVAPQKDKLAANI